MAVPIRKASNAGTCALLLFVSSGAPSDILSIRVPEYLVRHETWLDGPSLLQPGFLHCSAMADSDTLIGSCPCQLHGTQRSWKRRGRGSSRGPVTAVIILAPMKRHLPFPRFYGTRACVRLWG